MKEETAVGDRLVLDEFYETGSDQGKKSCDAIHRTDGSCRYRYLVVPYEIDA